LQKEVKAQISCGEFFGLAEEEHAGARAVFPSYDLGEEFSGDVQVKQMGHTFADATSMCRDFDGEPAGRLRVDKKYPDINYVPEDARFDLHKQIVSWAGGKSGGTIQVAAGKTYVRPSGYKCGWRKPGENRSWRLVGTVGEGLLCHNPAPFRVGQIREISKPITDAVLTGRCLSRILKRILMRSPN